MKRQASFAKRRALIGAVAVLSLAGCGFQLRGSAKLPYESIYVDLPESNQLGADLRRYLRAGTDTRITTVREDAQAILAPLREARSKTILSLSSSGRVREFRLKYNVDLRVTDRQGRDLIAPMMLLIERDFAFNDNQVLAKEGEEALIYRDMQSDMIQQILRRIEAAPLLKQPG
jgi:LPS-assembly lipoprotein